MAIDNSLVEQAIQVLKSIGLPRGQQNERSALCLLALLNLSPGKSWNEAENPLMGITPVMDWVRAHYQKAYAPNSRETFRRFTMHQLLQAAVVVYNPDAPGRPVNSPKAVYQVERDALTLFRSFGGPLWNLNLSSYLARRVTLTAKYARSRRQNKIPVQLTTGKRISLSPGRHSDLIRAVIEDFAPRFAPGSALIYAGDTADKWGYFNEKALNRLGVRVDWHGKMPDVVLHLPARNWLLLVECVTSHGPVDSKRRIELADLFADAMAELVYVTALPDRATMSRYATEIAWETEVWVADAPSHLIHYNGERFLGPYGT